MRIKTSSIVANSAVTTRALGVPPDQRNKVFWLLLTIVILALSIIIEWHALRGQFDTRAPLESRSLIAEFGNPITSKVDIQAEVKLVLARPLFSENRRAPPPNSRTFSILPRLTGVLITQEIRIALFDGGSAGKCVSLGQGDRLGDFIISLVTPGEVVVTGPDGTRVLHPTFDAESDTPSTSPTPKGRREGPLSPVQVYKGPLDHAL